MANWYYVARGQTGGPIDAATLRKLAAAGQLTPIDKVRREDMDDWCDAKHVKGLFPDRQVAVVPLASAPAMADSSARQPVAQSQGLYPRRQIQVTGENSDAVESMREFMHLVYETECESNPFRIEKYKLKISIDQVDPGDASIRWLTSSIGGRPVVSLHFALEENGRTITERRLTTSVWWQDFRDVGFMGSSFGGTNASFIRSNCRKLAKQIVDHVATTLALPPTERKQLLAAIKRGGGSPLIWIAVSAGVIGLALSIVGYVTTSRNEKTAGLIGGLVLGVFVGILVGAIFSVLHRSILKMRGR
jgi:hypothetical protein